MGGVIRNRRLVREKPEGGLITRLPPTTRFPRSGRRGLLPNDANVPIPAGLCRGSARWALITPRTCGQACSSHYLSSAIQSGSARQSVSVGDADPERRVGAGGLLGR